jgi:selenoprotein W-related protein
LTSRLLGTYKQQIRDLKLIPSSGGCFELTADGELLYSKLETGKFPDEGKVVEAVGARLKKKKR